MVVDAGEGGASAREGKGEGDWDTAAGLVFYMLSV